MTATLTSEQVTTLSRSEHEQLRHLIAEACEPIAKFWPMKDFVHHNPLHGLEHLPFDKAVRQAKHLLDGNGYLSAADYRRLYREGRITAGGVARALKRQGPRGAGHTGLQVGSRRVEPLDVWRTALVFGFEPLGSALSWTLGPGGAARRFQEDLPAESRQRIRQRWEQTGKSARDGEETYVRDLWESALEAASGGYSRLTGAPAAEIALPAHRTVGDWLDMVADASIVEQINDQMTKWVAAFVDEGMAGWGMPSRRDGLYQAWRDLAPSDFSGRFLGIRNFSQKVRDLPAHPEDAILLSLERLRVPQERWMEYISRHMAQLPGWAGFIRWLGANPAYPGQADHPTNPVQYLAVRLFYEVELAAAFCDRKWNLAATVPALVSHWEANPEEYQRLAARRQEGDHAAAASAQAWRLFRLAQFLEFTPAEVRALSSEEVQTLLGWLDSFPEDSHGPVWLEAYEDKYREDLLGKLTSQRRHQMGNGNRPRAQIVFCIDVRSESFRRHVEAQGAYQTYGFAGFFGVTMNYQSFDSKERFPLCPVLLKPAHAVNEELRPGQVEAVQSYASGTRWRRLGDHLFHGLKQNPVASFMLVDVLGFFFALGLLGKTLFPKLHESIKGKIRSWFDPSPATRVLVNKAGAHENGFSSTGFTREEQAAMVENGLRAIGLTKQFGRFIVLCGHGSVSDNNPYFGALHCGACGGKHGDPNARAFAAMANDPKVRGLLQSRGLEIPDDTWFLGAKHITTSDRIVPYDVEEVPPTHYEDLQVMSDDWEKAGAMQALERCSRLPHARNGSSVKAYQHVAARTVDWSNSRPEWGLSSNAAFVVGRRSLTQSASLQGRVFLHSYDPEQDPEGKILEKIMTAPLIVGEWINMEHYFSAVDPWCWGSGSKVIHNVVSGVGVMLGSHGDLQTGLPLQTVNNGASHYHEPMRLLTVIEAPTSRISQTIQKHALLQRLFHNQWLNLVAVDPAASHEFQRYNPDGTWELVAAGARPEGVGGSCASGTA